MRIFLSLLIIIAILINLYAIYAVYKSNQTISELKTKTLKKYELVNLTAKEHVLINRDIDLAINKVLSDTLKYKKLAIATQIIIILWAIYSLFQ